MAHAVAGTQTPATPASHRLKSPFQKSRTPDTGRTVFLKRTLRRDVDAVPRRGRYPTLSMRFSGGGATGECAPT